MRYQNMPMSDEQFRQKFLNMFNSIEKSDGCWCWPGALDYKGYGQFSHGGGRTYKAHRFSYQTWVGAIPDGLLVCHKCDNPKCVRPDHLFLGTCADNNNDAIRKGRRRSTSGQNHHAAKMTDIEVVECLALRGGGESVKSLSLKYNVSGSTISRIVRQIYRKIKPPMAKKPGEIVADRE